MTVGVYPLYITGFDETGNHTTIEVYIQIVDTIAPTFDYIPYQTIEAGEYWDIDWTDLIVNVQENSGIYPNLFEDLDNVEYDIPGTYPITVGAVDQSLNITTQTFYVTVVDTTGPTFDVIPNQTIEAGDYTNIDWTTYILNEADNAYGVLTKIEVEDNVDYDTPGTYTVTVKVVDESDNETSLTFNVIVVDTTGPTFDSIPYQSLEASDYDDIDWTTYIQNLEDNSDGVIILTEDDGVMYGYIGPNSVTVTATDSSGNFTSFTFDVLISDTIEPDLTYIGEYTYELNSTEPDFADLFSAIDLYEGDVSYYMTIVDNTDFTALGTYSVSATVHDTGLNYNYLEITITIVDTEAPTFDTIPYQIIEASDYDDIDWTIYIQNLQDNSNGTIILVEVDYVMYGYIGVYTAGVTATDPSGNTTSQTFIVDILDTLEPDLT